MRAGYRILLCLVALVTVVSCAKMATPEGGPYDVVPPQIVKIIPADGSTMVQDRRVQIYFDEYIKLERGQDNIIYSPPQRVPPKTVVDQKRLLISYQDSLIPNTTYTIDFTNAISDYNEGNVLEHFVYAFSTGSFIDTMQVGGVVLDAYTLAPAARVLAGIYDSAVPLDTVDRPMMRMTMTDDEGRFLLQNVHNGRYRAIALIDMDRSYSYNAPNESFGMSAEDFQTEVQLRSDYERSLKGDSIASSVSDSTSLVEPIDTLSASSPVVSSYVYTPSDLTLLLSRPLSAPIRLEKLSRQDSVTLVASFSQPIDTLPQLTILSPSYLAGTDKYYTDLDKEGKKITYWLSPNELLAKDSLQISYAYPTTDSIGSPINKIDTLTLRPVSAKKQANRRPSSPSSRQPSNAKSDGENTSRGSETPGALTDSLQSISALSLVSFYSKKDLDKSTTRDSLWLVYPEPIIRLDDTKIHLYRMVDTVSNPISFAVRPDSKRQSRYLIDFPKEPGQRYRIVVDSNAVTGLYSANGSPAAEHELRIAKAEELGSLKVTLSNYPTDSPIYVYLLNKTEEQLAMTQPDSVGLISFTELIPGEYYLKLFVDANANGQWDGGVYPYTQPEVVNYLPKALSVQVRFATQETWTFNEKPLAEQRPLGLALPEGNQNKNANPNSPKDKSNLNTEYIQRMKDRYGERWNPTNRERAILGMPSREEEKAAKMDPHEQKK